VNKKKAKKIRQALRKAGFIQVKVDGAAKWKSKAGNTRYAKTLSEVYNKIKI
jgi:hypothetical protein